MECRVECLFLIFVDICCGVFLRGEEICTAFARSIFESLNVEPSDVYRLNLSIFGNFCLLHWIFLKVHHNPNKKTAAVAFQCC